MQKLAFALLLATCGAAFPLRHSASEKLKLQGYICRPAAFRRGPRAALGQNDASPFDTLQCNVQPSLLSLYCVWLLNPIKACCTVTELA